jgi:two-component system sensor histidine kinase GlrK
VSALMLVEELSDRSQATVQQVITRSDAIQHLQDRLGDLERKSRKYMAWQDATSLHELRLVHEQFERQMSGIIESVRVEDGRLQNLFEALSRDEKKFFDLIVSSHPNRSDRSSSVELEALASPLVSEAFQSIRGKASDLAHEYAEHTALQADKLRALSASFRQRLIIDISLLLPVSCVLLAIFVYLLHNPMRQIDHVIRGLGAGNFTQPVRVVGTGDVEFLGGRLEWLRSRLNDLETAKQRFVRNVSHEVKTPLANIHEGAELLLDQVVGELNQEQRDIAQVLVNNADKLDRLIADLINYSQVSARGGYQKMALVDVRQLLLEVLEDYQLQLRAKSITVIKSLDYLAIMGSKEQLSTIIDNLLSNAVKYSPSNGSIRIALMKDGGHMVLEMEDDGPGIDPDERQRVFEPFFRGRAAHELGIKGTGFGLAIVAECVSSHHGKVEVLDSLGDDAGVRIRVQIPMQSFA